MCYHSELHHAPDSFLEKVKGWGGGGGLSTGETADVCDEDHRDDLHVLDVQRYR